MDFSLMLILFNRRGFHLFCLYALFHWTQSRVCNGQTYSCAHLHCRVLLCQAQTCSYGIPFSEINVELHTAFKSERLGNIIPGFSTRMFLVLRQLTLSPRLLLSPPSLSSSSSPDFLLLLSSSLSPEDDDDFLQLLTHSKTGLPPWLTHLHFWQGGMVICRK